jgi:hypothetical protein
VSSTPLNRSPSLIGLPTFEPETAMLASLAKYGISLEALGGGLLPGWAQALEKVAREIGHHADVVCQHWVEALEQRTRIVLGVNAEMKTIRRLTAPSPLMMTREGIERRNVQLAACLDRIWALMPDKGERPFKIEGR